MEVKNEQCGIFVLETYKQYLLYRGEFHYLNCVLFEFSDVE